MADPIEYGVAIMYGLLEKDAFTYLVVQSDDWSDTFALDVEVSDEQGRVITDHLDDRRAEVTIDGVIKVDEDLPEIGSTFDYSGGTFILKSIDDKGTNKDFRKLSIKGIKYQEITIPPPA
jgi:hypothetical protein